MTEVKVKQCTEEWFELRQSVQLTASMFGDAVGLGQGKPIDFLKSILVQDEDSQYVENTFTKHGKEYEPIINEAYELLTGNITESSGFWIPRESDPLFGMIGASPDGKVFLKDGVKCNGLCDGLVEFKAPVYAMYDEGKVLHGIPRRYMAQIQGQMAVCGMQWCDFMAVCVKQKSILLKRVFFSPVYWKNISAKLKFFACVLKEAKTRYWQGCDPLGFADAQFLAKQSMHNQLFTGENVISVRNMLQKDNANRYRCGNGAWLSFDFLLGLKSSISTVAQKRLDAQIAKLDYEIEIKKKRI